MSTSLEIYSFIFMNAMLCWPYDSLPVHAIAYSSFIYHSPDCCVRHSVCCFPHLKCQWFCNRNLFLCHKYHRAKHKAIPQERDASKTQLYCPSKPSVSHCVHLHELGEQARLLFMDWKNTFFFFFFPSLQFHERGRSRIHVELLLLFVDIFQACPADLRHSSGLSKHLHSCHLLDRHLRHSCPCGGFTDIMNTAMHGRRNMQQNTSRQSKQPTNNRGARSPALASTNTDFMQRASYACTHAFIDSGDTQINTYPCRVLM